MNLIRQIVNIGVILFLSLRLIPVQSGPLSRSISNGFVPADEDVDDVVEVSIDKVPPTDPNIFDLSVFGSSLYSMPDFNNTARLVSEYIPGESAVNPEELGSYVEGDILVPQTSIILKNGLVSSSSRWPDAVVPYEITGHFRNRDLVVIANAINEYHEKTCIRFIPRSRERDYISIGNGQSGCWSSVGRVGGKQEVNLQAPGCLSKRGTTMHELMHVLGFLHEQNRQERDAFVAIRYENIKQAAYANFKKMSPTVSFGVPYDYGSVMHYSAKAFSLNGQPTIESVEPQGNYMMGQRDGFSPLDIDKINRMYKCYEKSYSAVPIVEVSDLMLPPPTHYLDSRPPGKLWHSFIRG